MYFAITRTRCSSAGKCWSRPISTQWRKQGLDRVDSLFQWTPRSLFHLHRRRRHRDQGFGHTIAGVSFQGELSGMKPWHLEGHAKTDDSFLGCAGGHRPDRMGRATMNRSPDRSRPRTSRPKRSQLSASLDTAVPAGTRNARAIHRGRHHAAARPSARHSRSETTERAHGDDDRPRRLEPRDFAAHATSPIRKSASSMSPPFRMRLGSLRPRPLHHLKQDRAGLPPRLRGVPLRDQGRASAVAAFGPAMSSDVRLEHGLSARGLRASTTELLKLGNALTALAVGSNAVANSA